ncbi:uncharacterized protein F4807DRAFT_425630 [Annulohypoxylon truncatum]|uniref:uncharacterized protein n=1 Tax=Annulohypoxylon truncatum TaxID=327061 RepID=UPI00200761C9|nr:uncharacterized protein F4807DRAFT_425630 [Annulohypoxylon truncatum]KAI1209620.1 hypothetical protein F4807DRAFT_425630 [Annulohypoxylon truncatum]
MAEFDDIEYEGIGEDRPIVVESDRCFRDHSPGDTVISLSDDGQALYSCAIPSFSDTPQTFPEPNSNLQQPQSQRSYEAVVETEVPSILCPLSHDALIAMQKHAPPGLQDELSPLIRYRCDPQAHEQRALGIERNDSSLHIGREPAPRTSPKANGNLQLSEISSLHLSSSPNPTPSTGRGSSSAAEQLRELVGMIGSPDWEDSLSPEEQAEHLRRATRLKRRVRSETNSRELRPPKVRKRNCVGSHDDKDYRQSS